MKKIKLLTYTLASVFFLLAVSLNSQPVTFQQEFDMPGEGVFLSSHIGTYDGGMMVLTSSYNNVSSAQSITFVKTSATGTVQWSKRFSPVGADYGNFVQAADSGYFLCYVERLSGTAIYQVLKLSVNGNVLFAKRLDVPAAYTILSEPRTIAKNDGGFYVACDLFDTLTSERRWHLFEINASGNLVWSHSYNITPIKGSFADIDTCQNGDIVLVGSVHNAVAGVNETVITRIAPGGTELWTKHYNCAGRSMYSSAVICMPGDYILVMAATWHPVTLLEEQALMKTDGQGNELWTFAFSNPTVSLESQTLERAENNRAVLLAATAAGGVMIKADTNGLMLCSRLYPT
ncbi:MAG TPA: hypothetical protein VK826_12175, partial [Bacteroidia bacterium]|nr:hypothetical protein [Bacteroidia bacterium]